MPHVRSVQKPQVAGKGSTALHRVFAKEKDVPDMYMNSMSFKDDLCSLVSHFSLLQHFYLGGGFHHCSSDKGGGFCAYADITLAIKVRGAI